MSEIANFRFSLRHGNLSELIANPDSVNLYEPIIAYTDTDSTDLLSNDFYFGFKVENNEYKECADKINKEDPNYKNYKFDPNNTDYINHYENSESETIIEKIYIYVFLCRSMENSTDFNYTEHAIWGIQT